MNAKIHEQLNQRKRRIQRRLDKLNCQGCDQPMFTASNIHYEISERDRGIPHGGIGVFHALARRLGVDEERSLRPQILATIAFAPLDAAMLAWFTSRSNQEIGTLLDEALETFNRERDAMCARMSASRSRPRRR